MTVLVWVAVMLIGGAGSVIRFLADGVVGSAAGRDFPVGTLAVNLSGAVILGLLTGLALGHDQALLAGTAGYLLTARGAIRMVADYEDLIVGFQKFCDGFAKVKPKADAIAAYINGNDPITGRPVMQEIIAGLITALNG